MTETSGRATERPASGPEPGLCGTCEHSRVVETKRGSLFRLCERSATDPAYPRYPALPVVRCAGYDPCEAGAPDLA